MQGTNGEKTKQDAAIFGIVLPPQEDVYLWEINAHIVELFEALMTQWRTSFGGVTGLDYSVVATTAQLLEIPLDKKCFNLLRKCELTALAIWHKENKS